MIHDLGKINVPAEILTRPGRLSEIEFEFIKTHPAAGFEIVRNIEFPWRIADAILQHHKRLDGSGCPHGARRRRNHPRGADHRRRRRRR